MFYYGITCRSWILIRTSNVTNRLSPILSAYFIVLLQLFALVLFVCLYVWLFVCLFALCVCLWLSTLIRVCCVLSYSQSLLKERNENLSTNFVPLFHYWQHQKTSIFDYFRVATLNGKFTIICPLLQFSDLFRTICSIERFSRECIEF